jgi:hypothetical protein
MISVNSLGYISFDTNPKFFNALIIFKTLLNACLTRKLLQYKPIGVESING